MNFALLVLALTVAGPQDARVVPALLPGETGLAVIQWTPALNAPPIFNHLVDAPSCRLLIGTHYEGDYQTPVLRASIGATHHCRSVPVVLERGRAHVIVVFWRVVGGMREMGIYLDNRLVGHLWEPARPVVTWAGATWIGMRAGGEPVGDPTFPGRADADGRLAVAIWTE